MTERKYRIPSPSPKTDSTCAQESILSRRGFIFGAAGAIAVFAVGGTAKLTASASLLRPPGCKDEESFLAACLRCDRCRQACPHSAIDLASIDDGLINMRTPVLDFTKGYCDFCGAKQDGAATPLCEAVCATAALEARTWADEIIGVAVINTDECITYTNYAGCTVCVEACPYEAVSLNSDGTPSVDSVRCNGCGYCEYKCPSHSYRSFSGSARRGIYVKPIEA